MIMIKINKAEQFKYDLRRLRYAGASVSKVMEPRLGVHRVQLYRYMQEPAVVRGTPTDELINRVRPALDQLLQEYGLA